MFQPKYHITHRLLENIKKINNLVNELNNRRFPRVVLLELERAAREVSSYASTSIEGNPLPLTEVKKILKSKPEHMRDSELEVLNYNHVLQDLNKRLEEGKVKLSLELLLNIQKQVTKGLLPIFESGHLRQRSVAVHDPRTGQTTFLPPDVKDVEPFLKDLIDFVRSNRGKIDPLILAGIFHKQMVLIHPFTDGNGRTTRLATKVLLAEMGLNTFNLFSFENYYNQNVSKYFQTVGELGNYNRLAENLGRKPEDESDRLQTLRSSIMNSYTSGFQRPHIHITKNTSQQSCEDVYYDLESLGLDFTSWLEYFTGGIIDELLRVQKILPHVSISPESQLQPYHLKILEFIQEKGFISNRDYAKLTDRAKATRTLDFQKLIDLKLIKRMGKGRATYYILSEK